MRLETVQRDVSSSGVMEVSQAKVKATKKVFDMFSDHTYANKPVAILRELVANGVDAHVAAGRGDRAVEVQLPTPLDPTCRIRDFGTGMPHSFVMNEFMEYTNGSTKDQSDDQIGGWGIGSKSPFSYVDQYTLRVVHDGVLGVYTMFKDADGIPAIGLQAQTTTSEPNGVEVSFPVEDADMDTFIAAAQEALQYFQPLPVVCNGTLNAPDYTYKGTDWAMRPKAGPLGIILGGVRYPADTSSFSSDLRYNSRLKPLLDYGLDLTLPINACNVAMSREGLSYTPKTSTSVAKALEAVIDDVIATFANYFDKAPSLYEAMRLLYAETGMDSYSRSGRAQLLLANAKYKGNKLETSFRVEPSDFTLLGLSAADVRGWRIQPARSRRSSNCPSPKWEAMVELYGITPYNIESIIIDDLPQDDPKSKSVRRIKEFVNNQSQAKETIVVRGGDATALLALMRNPDDYVLTSSLPEPAKAAPRAKSVRPRVRMFTFNGGSDKFTHRSITNLTPAVSKVDAVKEIAYADQPSSGIMVVMNAFDLPQDMWKQMQTGLVRYDELVFVNVADAAKIKATFKNYEDVFAERLAAALAKYPELPQRLAVSADSVISAYCRDFEKFDRDGTFDKLTKKAQQHPFGRLFKAWRTYVKPLSYDERRLGAFVTAQLPKGLDPKALRDAIVGDTQILLDVLDMDEDSHRGLFLRSL
jgi:hypothetical protein